MISITHFPVEIQTSPQEVPSVPSWFGEVAIVAAFLKKEGVLEAITQQVHLKRGRMGRYEVIDFVALLIGYALSAEPTLQAFFDRLLPFATPFMALFGRDQLPHRSLLSRFLAAVDAACLEHLRALFLQDLCARPCSARKRVACGTDRGDSGTSWISMAPVRWLVNVPCHTCQNCPAHSGALMRSAPKAMLGANAVRWSGRAPCSRRPAPTNGWEPFLAKAMVSIKRSCSWGSRSSGSI
jgi:hypothetical protein